MESKPFDTTGQPENKISSVTANYSPNKNDFPGTEVARLAEKHMEELNSIIEEVRNLLVPGNE